MEITEPLPLWGWYRYKNLGQEARVRAMHMDRRFSYESAYGSMAGNPGDWLVEEPDGKRPIAFSDAQFRENFVALDPERPEMGQPPEPAPPFKEVPGEPDTEALQ